MAVGPAVAPLQCRPDGKAGIGDAECERAYAIRMLIVGYCFGIRSERRPKSPSLKRSGWSEKSIARS
jgi:hypothetical protein